MLIGDRQGQTTNIPTTNSSQSVQYRNSSGAIVTVGANTTMGIDFYGSGALLVCVKSNRCLMIHYV